MKPKSDKAIRDLVIQQALRESEERYRSVLENSPSAIMTIDGSYRLTYVNEEACRLGGYSREELTGQDFRSFLDEESRQLVAERYIRRQRGEDVPSRYEFNIVCKNGEKRRVEASSAVVKRASGAVETIAQLRDITEQKRAEQALRESEERYRQLIELSPDAIILRDEEKVTFVNAAGVKLFGASNRAELIGKPAMELVHPDYREITQERFRRVTEAGEQFPPIEKKLLRLDGSIIDAEVAATPITHQNKPALQVIIRNITERKRAEQELRESEERYRQLVELSPDAIYIREEDRIVFINAAGARLFGAREPGELIGKSFMGLLHPDYHEIARERVRYIKETGEQAPPLEEKFIRLDGTAVYGEVAGSPIAYQNRSVVQVIVRDITERKRAEQALRESEAFVSSLFDSITDYITVQDTEYSIIKVNKKVEQVFGKDLLGKKCYRAYQDRDSICPDCPIARALATGEPVFAVKQPNPKAGIMETSAFPMRDEAGNLIAVIEHGRDISERERVEKALEESENIYQTLVSVASQTGIGIALLQDTEGLEASVIFANEEFARITGYTCEELPRLSWLDIVHPTHSSEVTSRYRKRLRGKFNPSLVEYSIVTKGGKAKPIELSGSTITHNGKQAVVIYIRDITERKQASAELLRLNTALRRSFMQTAEALAAAVDAKDPYTHGHSQKVARYATAIGKEMGLPPEELENLRLAGILHDLGKIAVPAEILSRPRALSPQEFALVRTHVEASSHILEGVDLPQSVKGAIASHHERYDGSGYPSALSGQQINPGGRILAVADAIEAMSSDRPYRKGMKLTAILRELARCAGSQFDPRVVSAFMRTLRRGNIGLPEEPAHEE